ncbi:DnaJ domain-containing protein [Corallococcus sp. CA041A]|nr:DnaJ domain-containing protein [Corallococcus sp. CA041A]
MFETFDSASSAPAARRFALSTTASVAVFGLIAVAAMTAANTVKEVIKEKKVDVVFRPPPPPPPPAAAGGPALSPEQLADLESRCAKLDQLDYFELLGLERTAVPGDIKKAFYKESRVYHPDRFFHLESKALKDQVNELYKRVTEAYYVLRDDTKRKKYLSDIAGPDRAQKLRFTDASESETKAAAKKEQEEQIGTHPKGRQFYTQAQKDLESGNPSAAERNLKMALTYEPANARYKEALAEAQKQTADKSKGDSSFKIR